MCDSKRHGCTSATCFSQRTRFCQSAHSFLSKVTLKIGKLEFEDQTQVHFCFGGCNFLTVTYHIQGCLKNLDFLHTLLASWITFALFKHKIVLLFPEFLKHWTTNYYFFIIIKAFVLPSIQNPSIQFHSRTTFLRIMFLMPETRLLWTIWKTLVLVK